MILTKKKLGEILEKNYMVSNVVSITTNETRCPHAFMVVYPYNMVRIQYYLGSGWCFQIFGETSYSVAKAFIKICDFLDANKFTFKENTK